MSDCKCSFAITLIKQDFGCKKAQGVTRRAGPDIACTSETVSSRCESLMSVFKKVGLAAFDAEDDLLKTPQSVFSKIQFGGLLGLAKDIANTSDLERVEDIFRLVEWAQQHYVSIDCIPVKKYVPAMLKFKIKRKRK